VSPRQEDKYYDNGGAEEGAMIMNDEVEAKSIGDEEELLQFLAPTYANWADQVEFEEAQLAEIGQRLMLTWEELHHSSRTTTTTTTTSSGYRPSATTAMHSSRGGKARGLRAASRPCHYPMMPAASMRRDAAEDELGEYMAMIHAARSRPDRPKRGLPPPRSHNDSSSSSSSKRPKPLCSSSFADDVAFHAAAVRSAALAIQRAHKGRAAAPAGEEPQQQRQRGTKRKSRSRSLDTENDRAADDKKTKNGANKQLQQQRKKEKQKEREKAASEAGRKLFVGGIVFADLEDDTEAREVRSSEEAALLAEVRREVFVDVVLGAFGVVDRIKAEWDDRYCHVVYSSRAEAERAFAGLSDHQERRRLCETEAAALLREEGLPEAAAPLPNFYVRWPKDDPVRVSTGQQRGHRRCRTSTGEKTKNEGGEGQKQEHDQARLTEGEDASDMSAEEDPRDDQETKEQANEEEADEKEEDVEEEEGERRLDSALTPSAVSAFTLLRDQLALQLMVGVERLAKAPGGSRTHHGPSAFVLCLLTLYSCILPCIVLPH
jgi:hypothetical protein